MQGQEDASDSPGGVYMSKCFHGVLRITESCGKPGAALSVWTFTRRETFSIESKVNSLHYLSSFETTCCPPRSQQPVPERLPTLKSPCLMCYFSCTVNEVTHADTNTQPDIPKVISYDLRHYVHGNILKY